MKILNKLAQAFGGKLTVMPPVDDKKVAHFLESWNSGKSPAEWVEIKDMYSLMRMVVNPDKSVTFYGDQGYPAKAFRNVTTGELKLFDARIFSS